MSSRIRIFLLVIALIPITCSMQGPVSLAPADSVSASEPVLIQAPENATPTSTPFMPLPPTATYIPTSFPTALPTSTPVPATPTPGASQFIGKSWNDYPGPTIWPDIDIPGPAGLLPQPNNQINILLLGSDQRQSEPGFRTDTILLLTLNPNEGTATLTSFPRDLYIYIPGWTVQRINTAFPHGGFETMALTFEYNFGVRPDYYMVINFWSFTQVVDSLGGIDVQVARTLSDHRDKYGPYTVRAGTVRMDGETALWYVRSRYSTSDFDRTRRQQEVIKAMFLKLLNLNAITRAPELYDIYKRNVSTNLTFDAIKDLVPLAAQLTDNSKLRNFYIGREHVRDWRNSSGAAVLLPTRELVLQVMRQALNSP